MPKQLLLSGFPEGAQKIGVLLSILEKDEWVTYFVGGDNYFLIERGDAKQAFRAGEPDGKWTRAGVRSGGFTFAHSTPHPDELDGTVQERRTCLLFSYDRSSEASCHDSG